MSNNNGPLITYQTKEEEQPIYDEVDSFQALGIAACLAFPMVFKAALELGIIHIIASLDKDVWLSSCEITSKLPTKPTNPGASVLIDRMLFLLASHSVLKCRTHETGRVYAAEPVCKFFLKPSGDGSGSLMPLFMFNQSEVSFKSWYEKYFATQKQYGQEVLFIDKNVSCFILDRTHLKDIIQEGSDSFISAHGMKVFEYIGLNKPVGELFNQAMIEASTMVMKKVLEVYKGFEDVNTLADVGGGLGTVLHSITSKYPNIKGINFDLPQVLSSAPAYPGIENIPGDMFIEIPKADAIFMKWILHNWTDGECTKILENCRKSLPENWKVILLDMITPTQHKTYEFSSSTILNMDMLMLTQFSGGKERSISQIKELASNSGFLRCEIICPVYYYSVIELKKIDFEVS